MQIRFKIIGVFLKSILKHVIQQVMYSRIFGIWNLSEDLHSRVESTALKICIKDFLSELQEL